MNKTQNIGNYRYRILGLLMFATTINYFDRSLIGVMAPTLEKMFEWTNSDYANIMVSFKVAYAIALAVIYGTYVELVLDEEDVPTEIVDQVRKKDFKSFIEGFHGKRLN